MTRRDVVVNTLLGAFLLFVFFVCLTGIGLLILFGFLGLDWMVARMIPGGHLPAGFAVFGAWVLWSLWYVVKHVREQRWRNALLFFISIPVAGLSWFTPIQTSLGGSGNVLRFFLPLIMIVGAADDANLNWPKFCLAAGVAGAWISVNSGFLGSGFLSQTVADCVLALAAAWWIFTVWNKYKTSPTAEPPALP